MRTVKIELDRLGLLVRQFWRWWVRELVEILPTAVVMRLHRRRAMLLFAADAEAATADYLAADGRREIVAIKREAGEELDRRLVALIADARRRAFDTVVLVPEQAVIRKTVRLPTVARSDLREILSHEIDRHTPLAAERAYFDFRIVEQRADKKDLLVELAAVERTVVDRLVGLVDAYGLTPKAATVQSELASPGAFDFLPRVPVRAWQNPVRIAEAILATICVFLVAAIVYVSVDGEKRHLSVIRTQVEQARKGAQVVESLQKEAAELTERSSFLAVKKREVPVIQLLDELSRTIPDEAWIYEIQLNGKDARIFGFSRSASGLIGLLDGSADFTDAQFRSPVTQGSRKGTERFDLSFHVRRTIER